MDLWLLCVTGGVKIKKKNVRDRHISIPSRWLSGDKELKNAIHSQMTTSNRVERRCTTNPRIEREECHPSTTSQKLVCQFKVTEMEEEVFFFSLQHFFFLFFLLCVALLSLRLVTWDTQRDREQRERERLYGIVVSVLWARPARCVAVAPSLLVDQSLFGPTRSNADPSHTHYVNFSRHLKRRKKIFLATPQFSFFYSVLETEKKATRPDRTFWQKEESNIKRERD